jgi:adenylosuccinate synthase
VRQQLLGRELLPEVSLPRFIVLLTGPVSAGKTTLASSLVQKFAGVVHIKTSEFLLARAPKGRRDRGYLQRLGERLDRQTGGTWVRDDLAKRIQLLPPDATVVVDAARAQSQIDAIRAAYGRRVLRVHLDAAIDVLSRRYRTRRRTDVKELKTYEEVRKNKTERLVTALERTADICVRTDRCTAEDVVVRAAAHIGLFGRNHRRLVDVIVGGQFGSEGKGQVAAYLAPEYDLLVRVGGPNAGHTVHEAPEPYVFHLLPSGTKKNPNAQLVIGPGATLRTEIIMREVAECQVDSHRLAIDPQAMIIEPQDIAQERELGAQIGSTCQGGGAAMARRIMGRSTRQVRLAKDIKELRPFIREACSLFEAALRDGKRILLEGTQGTGLSLYHGWYPYVTSRDTTVAGCLAEAGLSPMHVRKVVMVCRTYPIRVQSPRGGTSGRMAQEISWATVSDRSGIDVKELRQAERTSTTKRRRRVAEFDWALLRKASSLNAPTDIALTFVDYIASANRNARRFEQLTEDTVRFIEEVERVSCAPVSLISTRFHSHGIIDRRRW